MGSIFVHVEPDRLVSTEKQWDAVPPREASVWSVFVLRLEATVRLFNHGGRVTLVTLPIKQEKCHCFHLAVSVTSLCDDPPVSCQIQGRFRCTSLLILPQEAYTISFVMQHLK